jgi:hypothetical protein
VLPSPIPGASGILGSTWFIIGYLLITSVFWLGTLYFVDASALVARRADPLLRDTIHWSKVRYVLWAFQIFNVSFIILGTILSIATGNNALANQIMQGNNGAITSIPAMIANFAWAVAFGSFIVFVPMAFRAKDLTLRRHFKWLALMAGLTGLYFVIGGITNISANTSAVGNLAGNTIFFLTIAYCLYRSARALVPLNRLSISTAS